ncbi:hypothetical protein EKE94_03030 [Mesobaculum littorinae]|uniref:Terminase large subunit gp17-like C-terminal domain-containing protein n=1 Tax=Mesobaculum littorinae TaxID=2486419 RepID=A0A438ALE5_9RHOB|nr:hypothetical protein [Mesobaculum littorinae]RVV99671.1 hypothetical protein EKE94_03030 [Mesobaculum littorinae]
MASEILVERPSGWHAVAELAGITDPPDLIEAVQSKWPGHRITIHPDATSMGRKKVNASTSDIALLRQAGFTVRAKDSNPPVKDRVLQVNCAFSPGDLWVNDRACPRLAEALEQQARDRNGEPDKTGSHVHPVDSLGYPVHWQMPIWAVLNVALAGAETAPFAATLGAAIPVIGLAVADDMAEMIPGLAAFAAEGEGAAATLERLANSLTSANDAMDLLWHRLFTISAANARAFSVSSGPRHCVPRRVASAACSRSHGVYRSTSSDRVTYLRRAPVSPAIMREGMSLSLRRIRWLGTV